MYAEITAGLRGIKTLADLADLVLTLKLDSAVTAKAIESQSAIISLQSAILAVQTQNYELLEENKQLKEDLINSEAWELEAEKYSLTEVGGRGGVVYMLKSEYAESSPKHYLCPNCFLQKQKSILQQAGLVLGRTGYGCARCPMMVSM